MNNLRFIITFILLGIVIVLAIFQMNIRGYEELGRINEYVLYQNTDIECNNETIELGNQRYTIVCTTQYILKSGFAEYTITEAIYDDIVTLDDLSEDITIREE